MGPVFQGICRRGIVGTPADNEHRSLVKGLARQLPLFGSPYRNEIGVGEERSVLRILAVFSRFTSAWRG